MSYELEKWKHFKTARLQELGREIDQLTSIGDCSV